MRREFTSISVFSMLVATAAGAVLCVQLAQLEPDLGFDLSGPLLWAVEVGIFGTAVYLWQTEVSLGGWALGITALVLMRLLLSLLAAGASGLVHREGAPPMGLQQLSALAPRMCAIFFSLMVCYPLRIFLPRRPRRAGRQGRRFAESAAAQPAPAASGDSVWSLMIVPRNDAGAASAAEAAQKSWRLGEAFPSAVAAEATVEIPLRAVFAQIPQHLLQEAARDIDDSSVVSIPLDVIQPQLREAEIVVTLAQIREWLPPGARKLLVESSDPDEEREPLPAGRQAGLKLPLELIVPQLPPGALALPPPSPPAWASTEEAELVVFATV